MQRVTSPVIQSVSASQVEGDPVNGQFLLYKNVAADGQTVKYVQSANSWIPADLTVSGSLTGYLALSGGAMTGHLSGTTTSFERVTAGFFFGNGSGLTHLNALPLSGGTLTGSLTGTTAAFSEVSANYFYGDGSRLTNVGTPNALPLTGGSISDFLYVSGSFSSHNMLLGQEDEGAFFGRTRIRENNILLTEATIGTTWTSLSTSSSFPAQKTWVRIDTNSNGRVTAALANNDYIYISTNYGATWAAKGLIKPWSGIAMSLDGKVMIATTSGVTGEVYMSTDYGENWTAVSALSNKDWRAVAMSSDGKFITAVAASGQIHVSSTYGVSWALVDSSRDWRDVAMSSDGRLQTAVVHNGQIYVSSDYGSMWVGRGSSGTYNSVSMSSDGKVQIVTNNDGNQIVVSTSFGQNWELTGDGQGPNWISSAISSDGKYVTAIGSSGLVYTSTNYGRSSPWISPFAVAGAPFRSITMSSDAKVQFLATSNGFIYISNAASSLTGPLVVNGAITVTQSLSVGSMSVGSMSVGTLTGDGSKLTGIVTSVASRTGAVNITTVDLSDFTSSTKTVIASLTGIANGLVPLSENAKIPLQYIAGSIAQLITSASLASLTALPSEQQGRDRENLYLTVDTSKIYRYSGVAPLSYVEIVSSPGDTDSIVQGPAGLANRTNRYFTGAMEDSLLKRTGGTMTGNLIVTAASCFFGEVSAFSLSASFIGDGSRITNIVGTDSTRLHLSGGVLSGSLSAVSLSAQRGLFTVSLSAPILSGSFVGDGSRLTNIAGVGTDTTKLALSGGVLTGSLSAVSLSAQRGLFTVSLSAPILSGSFVGDGSRLVNIAGIGTDVTKLPLSGGVLTGTLSAISLSAQRGLFTVSLSAPILSGSFVGDGTRLTNVVTSVASRTGAVTISTVDLSDFTSSTRTIIASLTGIANGLVPLSENAKIPLQYIAGSIALLITSASLASLTALPPEQQGRDRENLYLTNNNGKVYRYSGVAPLSYVEIVSSPGDTDSVPEGPVASANRTNRYYTGAREDELLKKSGGTMTGNLTGTSASFRNTLSATTILGNGANMTGIVTSVATRTGAVNVTTTDLADFNQSTKTVVREMTGIANGIVPLNASVKIPGQYLEGSFTSATINYIIDGGGSLITTGSKGFVQIPSNFTIQEWSIVADTTTSNFKVDVLRASYQDFPGTVSIVGGDPVTLTDQDKNRNTSAAWTTLNAGDFLQFVVEETSNASLVVVSLRGIRS